MTKDLIVEGFEERIAVERFYRGMRIKNMGMFDIWRKLKSEIKGLIISLIFINTLSLFLFSAFIYPYRYGSLDSICMWPMAIALKFEIKLYSFYGHKKSSAEPYDPEKVKLKNIFKIYLDQIDFEADMKKLTEKILRKVELKDAEEKIRIIGDEYVFFFGNA